jgi:hypothetical protein
LILNAFKILLGLLEKQVGLRLMIAKGNGWNCSHLLANLDSLHRWIVDLGKLVQSFVLLALAVHPADSFLEPFSVLIVKLLEACIIFARILPQIVVKSHVWNFYLLFVK